MVSTGMEQASIPHFVLSLVLQRLDKTAQADSGRGITAMDSIEICGFCNPKFQRLRDVFEDNFEKGLELGASLAVTLGGELVVDLWGGFTNAKRIWLWQEDTSSLSSPPPRFPPPSAPSC